MASPPLNWVQGATAAAQIRIGSSPLPIQNSAAAESKNCGPSHCCVSNSRGDENASRRRDELFRVTRLGFDGRLAPRHIRRLDGLYVGANRQPKQVGEVCVTDAHSIDNSDAFKGQLGGQKARRPDAPGTGAAIVCGGAIVKAFTTADGRATRPRNAESGCEHVDALIFLRFWHVGDVRLGYPRAAPPNEVTPPVPR